MRILVLTVVLAAVMAAPAGAACTRSADGPPVSVELLRKPGPGGYFLGRAVIACDRRTGARRTLRRGVLIADAFAGGRFVAWIELRGKRPALAVLANGRTGGVLRRRSTGAADNDAQVVVTSRGELGWNVGADVVFKGRRVGKGFNLDLEDDRTLRWEAPPRPEPEDAGRTYTGKHHWLDTRPPPRRGGCPLRERWRRVAETPEVVVSETTIAADDFGSRHAIRACLRATGRDPVIREWGTTMASGEIARVAGADRSWVVLVTETSDRYGCGTGPRVVEALELRTGRGGRFYQADEPCAERDPVPERGEAIAVTDAGVVAWIEQRAVYAVGERGALLVLDRGNVDGLEARGDDIHWRNAGVPRQAPL